jgi:hypothetical protein
VCSYVFEVNVTAQYDMMVKQGEVYRRRFARKNKRTRRPVNLTGYTALMQVRPDVLSNTVLLELGVGSGLTVHPTLGAVDVEFVIPLTVPMGFSVGVYDIVLKSSSGEREMLVEGAISVEEVSTRKVF